MGVFVTPVELITVVGISAAGGSDAGGMMGACLRTIYRGWWLLPGRESMDSGDL